MQPNLYNGKEYEQVHGYDMYDFGARGYYATIARFTSIDPLAENTPWQSPYSYTSNNFIAEIDWMGLGGSTFYSGDNYAINYVVINNDGKIIGTLDDDDYHIYLDEDGEWSVEDGKEGLKDVGYMLVPSIAFYNYIVLNNLFGGKAPGWYYGQQRISVNFSFGAQIGAVETYKFRKHNFLRSIGVNLSSIELLDFSIAFNGDIDFNYVNKNKVNIISQSITTPFFSIGHSQKFKSRNREDMTPISGTSEFYVSFLLPIEENSKMPFVSMSIVNSILNGQFSFGLSGACLFGVSISFDINFFYNK